MGFSESYLTNIQASVTYSVFWTSREKKSRDEGKAEQKARGKEEGEERGLCLTFYPL